MGGEGGAERDMGGARHEAGSPHPPDNPAHQQDAMLFCTRGVGVQLFVLPPAFQPASCRGPCNPLPRGGGGGRTPARNATWPREVRDWALCWRGADSPARLRTSASAHTPAPVSHAVWRQFGAGGAPRSQRGTRHSPGRQGIGRCVGGWWTLPPAARTRKRSPTRSPRPKDTTSVLACRVEGRGFQHKRFGRGGKSPRAQRGTRHSPGEARDWAP